MINTTKYTLQVNIAFINLIKKLKIYDEDLEKIMTKTITDYELLEVNYTKITQEDEFVTFIDDFLIYETLENLDNDKYSQKKRRKIQLFILQLYYLNKIFKQKESPAL